MKLYAWMSDPHEGEPEPYPMSFVHPLLGVMAMYSTRKDLMTSESIRTIAHDHAVKHQTTVRLVEADVVDTIDVIRGNGTTH